MNTLTRRVASMQVHITDNLLIQHSDGKFDTNKYGSFHCFSATIITQPEDGIVTPADVSRHLIESEPLIIDETFGAKFTLFCKLAREAALADLGNADLAIKCDACASVINLY